MKRPQGRTVSSPFMTSQEAREQSVYGIMWEKELTGHEKDWGFTLSEMTNHWQVSSRGVTGSELMSSHSKRPVRRQL